MDTLRISTETKQYPVYIGSGILNKLTDFLTVQTEPISHIMIIADKTVHELHGEALKDVLPASIEHSVFTIPAGEEAKTLNVYDDCMTYAINKGLDRQSCILAFGGGACGDLAGFVAATYMRGVRFIGIPTTILAHDSSVGGKVAVNHRLGKNLIGQFFHPEAVFYETKFLSSLPLKEIRSGMAEVIKHSLISDKSFYSKLKENLNNLTSIDQSFLINSLKQGIAIKAEIVKKDEREQGIRAYLNFGHTYGHAIENLEGYKCFSHGEAVMIGMIYSLYLSVKHADLSFDLSGFISWIKQLGYSAEVAGKHSFDEIYAVMSRDKKAKNKTPKFVLLKEVGHPFLTEISKSDLKKAHDFVQAIARK
ncbi:MAG: 3-dehydroquinate synthase [Bacillota bacterium]